jgi:hypothetical protein
MSKLLKGLYAYVNVGIAKILSLFPDVKYGAELFIQIIA